MMPASLDGGSLGRWFEQLCRIRYARIRELTVENGTKLKTECLPKCSAIYTFWWTGGGELLRSKHCRRDLNLKGPGGKNVLLYINDDWLGLRTDLPIPLYVGKTAAGLRKRVSQHLLLARQRILPLGRGAAKAKAPTTSCQLRAGIEHLFPDSPDTREIVLQNVGLSYVELDGEKHAANRFYLEDMAIGRMRPPLNVDIER
ncbi:MAG: hypothetical protein IH987_09685 [Planctomycetes bacterium]|nr:hypothetical protein [Planctomycetota bacterium]